MSGLFPKICLTVLSLLAIASPVEGRGGETRWISDLHRFGRTMITTSSTRSPIGKNSYGPGNLFDGDSKTDWIEGKAGD